MGAGTGPQPGGAGNRPPRTSAAPERDFFQNLSSKNAAMLCYIPVIGWIPAIVVLASQRFRENSRVRFHAFQGLYLFIAWLIVQWVIVPAARFGFLEYGLSRLVPQLLSLAIFAGWVVMLIKVYQDEDYRLPLLGELADRSVTEGQPF